MTAAGYRVACGSFARYADPEAEWLVPSDRDPHPSWWSFMDPDGPFVPPPGFATLEAAQAYAQRLVRASVEACRAPGLTPEAVFDAWSRWGDYAAVPGFDGMEWARWCAAHPATRPEDTDAAALLP